MSTVLINFPLGFDRPLVYNQLSPIDVEVSITSQNRLTLESNGETGRIRINWIHSVTSVKKYEL